MSRKDLDRAELGDRVAGALAAENPPRRDAAIRDVAALLSAALRFAPSCLDGQISRVADRLDIGPADTAWTVGERLKEALGLDTPCGDRAAPGVMIGFARTADHGGHLKAVVRSPDPWTLGKRILVGDYLRISQDEDEQEWKAWLWPVAGGALHISRECEEIARPSEAALLKAVQARLLEGRWWTDTATAGN